MPVVIGIDSSTQSTKVEGRDLDTGALLGAGRAPHPPTIPPVSEQPPESWWRALVRATLEADLAEPAAISVGGQQHGMVVLDQRDDVIRPAKLWNDTESASDSDALMNQLGAAEWARACGSVPVAAFTIAKLAWLARNEPENFARIRTVLLPHDWLNFQLTDQYATDRGDASGTGYWSPAEDAWRPDLLELIDPSIAAADWLERLPAVLDPTDAAGYLTGWAAHELGWRGTDILVGSGTGDNMAAALGAALGPGDVAISLGTSGTVFAVSATPTADATGSVAGFADATGAFLPLVCTLNATQATDTIARLLGVDLATLDAMAGTTPAGAGGAVLVPYFNGERTPNRPGATGTLAGLRSDVTREQIARAAFEGVICGLLDGLDALRSAGVPVDYGRLVLVGGGAKSARYRQTLADLTQRAVTILDADELVAAGACVQAAAALREQEPLAIARAWGLDRGAIVDPDPKVTADQAAAVRSAYGAARG